MLQQLYERLQQLKRDMEALPNENRVLSNDDWQRYLALVRKYQALRDEYVRLGGCLV